MLVSANSTGSETMSIMSDAVSVDSGPESEFEFNDLNLNVEEQKTGPKRRSGSN